MEQVTTTTASQVVTVTDITRNAAVQKRFSDILGKKSAGFVSSLISLSKTKALAEAEPYSVVASSLVAASLDLPIVPTLGFAAIVPFYDGKKKSTAAQFQIMTKGLIQLAQRSGQYKTISVTPVYEGDIASNNRFTGEITFNLDNVPDTSKPAIGYVAYMKLTNGFEKYLYMSKEELEAHAKKFSQTYRKGYGLWKDNFDAMAKKTVLKLLLSKYGPLSVDSQMQLALQADQASIRLDSISDSDIANSTLTYNDNVEEDLEAVEEVQPEDDTTQSRVKDAISKQTLFEN